MFLTGKYSQKAHPIECAESIFVKTTESACASEELCRLKKKMKVGQIVTRFSYKPCTRPFGFLKHVNS